MLYNVFISRFYHEWQNTPHSDIIGQNWIYFLPCIKIDLFLKKGIFALFFFIYFTYALNKTAGLLGEDGEEAGPAGEAGESIE